MNNLILFSIAVIRLNEQLHARLFAVQEETSLVHRWVRCPDACRCHDHLFKQLYTLINTMQMSSHHIAQGADGLWCVGAKSAYQPMNKSKTPS